MRQLSTLNAVLINEMSIQFGQKKNTASDGQQCVKVAIVDSGIELSHPYIGTIAGGVDISINDDGNPVYSADFADCFGHGTACAGIIRKKAPESEIYSVRVFDVSLIADGRALVAAIQWCIDNKMDVVNLSLGTTDVTFKASLQDICRRALASGVILVAAASNDGRASYPAVLSEVIGVSGDAINEPDGFYFNNDQPIEFVARGDEQRVCWLNGKHIMTGGTSFAAPHISGLIAGLLKENPNTTPSHIRELLAQRASTVVTTKTGVVNRSPSNRTDVSWIRKAVLYPFNKEMHSLVRYHDLLSFDVVGVADPAGKGLVGKDAGEALGEPPVGLRIQPRLEAAAQNADTLILGYVDQLSRMRKRDLLREYTRLALDMGLNVFCFQALPPEDNKDLYELARMRRCHIAYPQVYQDELVGALENPETFPAVDVPVLAVMGTSSQQGKFTLQLALRRRLMREGYRVGQLGTEHHSGLFGIDATFPMGYASPFRLPLQTYVPFLDYKIREICQRKRPDLILSGSQSGTIPYDVYEHSTHAMTSVAFLLGVKPDACVLVVNSIDDQAYIRDTIDGMRAICKAPTLALAMGDREKHIRAAYGRGTISTRKMEADEIEEHLHRLEASFQIPAVEILSDFGQQRVVETIIGYFSDNGRANPVSLESR